MFKAHENDSMPRDALSWLKSQIYAWPEEDFNSSLFGNVVEGKLCGQSNKCLLCKF